MKSDYAALQPNSGQRAAQGQITGWMKTWWIWWTVCWSVETDVSRVTMKSCNRLCAWLQWQQGCYEVFLKLDVGDPGEILKKKKRSSIQRLRLPYPKTRNCTSEQEKGFNKKAATNLRLEKGKRFNRFIQRGSLRVCSQRILVTFSIILSVRNMHCEF